MVTLSFIAILHGLVRPRRRQPLEHIAQNERKKASLKISHYTIRVYVPERFGVFFFPSPRLFCRRSYMQILWEKFPPR